jgi:Plasmid pRiA4b ORF-3-like protein
MKDSIVRICVTLLDADPAIWRRIEVPAAFTLEGLHDVLQTIMGWANYHLHHFQIGDLMYGELTLDDRDILDERKLKLSALAIDGERAFEYVYDYGDNWRCVVVLEAIASASPGVIYPRLVEGARRGPPEDVGGPRGYIEFLEAIADPKHERHKELREWIGGDFDPQQFDIDEIDPALARLAPRKTARRKAARSRTAKPALPR